MTVQEQVPFIGYTGDGVTVAFPYTFRILDQTHLLVALNGLIQGGGYAVSGVGAQGGGNVTFAVAPVLGSSVTLVRSVPATQLVDYQPFGPFPAETHEGALDKLTMEHQDNAALFLGSLRIQRHELPLQRNLQLPIVQERANLLLGFDSLGNVVASAGFGSVVNYLSDATGDAQGTVSAAWNAQADGLGITRAPDAIIFYRWPSTLTDYYRYGGNQEGPPWTSVEGDWALTNTGIFIPSTEKGVPNGVATLDGSGKVPVSQLPGAVANLFPVGAIYITANNMNPGTFIGGTWALVNAGRVLLGVGTLGSDTYLEGATGGEARHVLIESEIPSHNHVLNDPGHSHTYNSPNYAGTEQGGGDSSSPSSTVTSTSHVGTSITLNPTGGNAAHENRQPYVAVYFWQRTA
jgi:hypothetical protein